jgi:hypothetical protein
MGRTWSATRRQTSWACVGLAAFLAFVFRGAVFGGGVLYQRDVHMVWYPQVETFVRCIAAGSWPTWDPYRSFGQPLLADPSAQILYPTTWLNLILPPRISYTVFATLHLLLAGVGLYLLGRRYELSALASFVASIVWIGSGPLLSLGSLYHHLAGAAWIPWVFLAAERALRNGRPTSFVVLGGALGLQLLAGSADMAFFGGLALALYVLVHAIDWRSPFGLANRRLVAACALSVLVAVAVAAPQWLPTFVLARQAARWNLPEYARTTWSLHPLTLFGLVWPVQWHELPARWSGLGGQVEPQGALMPSIYLGVPALALVAASLCGRMSRRVVFWWAIATGAALYASGRYAPFYRLAVFLVPPLKFFAFPVKALVLSAFAWSVLAGIGVDAWRLRVPVRRWWPVVLAVALGTGLGAALLAIAPRASRLAVCVFLASLVLALTLAHRAARSRAALLTSAVAAVVCVDLALVHRDVHPVAPKPFARFRPPILDAFKGTSLPRLYVYDYSVAPRSGRNTQFTSAYQLASAPAGWTPAAAASLGVQMYLNPPIGGRWALFGSYDLDLLGLHPGRLAELNARLREAEDTPAHLRLLRLGGVTHVVALEPKRWWTDLAPQAAYEGLFQHPIRVFRVPDPLPRTYAVGSARVAPEPRSFDLLVASDFDPQREIVLPEGEGRHGADFSGRSRIVEFTPDRVVLEAELSAPGYVVLLDAYDPGWSAEVDGEPAPVLRANVLFRAVGVGAGRHRIEYRYRPPGFRAASALFATAVLVAAAIVARQRRDAPLGARAIAS